MEMRDKEFDRLFNARLNDLETEPSPMVWQKVAKQLDGKKATRGITTYLSIAASVVILISAGLFFYSHPKDKAVNKPDKNDSFVAHNKPQIVADSTPKVNDKKITVEVTSATGKAVKDLKKRVIKSLRGAEQTNKANESPSPQQVVEPLVASVPQREAITLPPAVPDVDIPLTPKALAVEQPVVNNRQPATVNAQLPDKAPEKKRGISGLGGLINAIVAKVDKREDKLVEFTESDDGALLTGVNLGLLRIKKQQ